MIFIYSWNDAELFSRSNPLKITRYLLKRAAYIVAFLFILIFHLKPIHIASILNATIKKTALFSLDFNHSHWNGTDWVGKRLYVKKRDIKSKQQPIGGSVKYACILWWSCFCFESACRGCSDIKNVQPFGKSWT